MAVTLAQKRSLKRVKVAVNIGSSTYAKGQFVNLVSNPMRGTSSPRLKLQLVVAVVWF